jgi:predicted dehydrogenase
LGKINIGIIGLGERGYSLLKSVILEIDYVDVLGVCDIYEDRTERGFDIVAEKRGNKPVRTNDYKVLLGMPEIDAIVITSAWESHLQIAMEAMNAGKYVGVEVGGAYSIDDCWKLVHTYEKTGTPCMMMENCCYGRNELMVLNMVRQGIFGDIVHCAGGYHHDLRHEISFGNENRHYRLRNYLSRNCENYPTHELGPIAKVLDINRGNRMLSLNSVASRAAGLSDFIKRKKPEDTRLLNAEFKQGDIVTTIIKCARGETIVLTLDTTLPRAYSRGFCVRGTKGMYEEQTHSIFLDGVHHEYDYNWSKQWGNADKYREEYEHPIWKKYLTEGVKGGHEGMDWLVFNAFFESVANKTQTPIDVYDSAAWMSISTLSEQSIACGGATVYIPDFTNGKWLQPQTKAEGKYSL